MARDLQDDQRWKYDELPLSNCWKSWVFMSIWWTAMNSNAPNTFGVTGHASVRRSLMLLGLFWLSGCHFGYSLSWQ